MLLAVAAEAVDEAAGRVCWGVCRGWLRSKPWAEEFALFDGFAASFFALFGFAVEGFERRKRGRAAG